MNVRLQKIKIHLDQGLFAIALSDSGKNCMLSASYTFKGGFSSLPAILLPRGTRNARDSKMWNFMLHF